MLTVSAYTVNDGNGGANYSVSTASNNAGVITKAPLTVSAGVNKVYDGTPRRPSILPTTASQATDSPMIHCATFTDKNVGTGKAVTVAGITISGPDAGNYTGQYHGVDHREHHALPLTISARASTRSTTERPPRPSRSPTTASRATSSPMRQLGDVRRQERGHRQGGDGRRHRDHGTDAGNYTLASTTATTTANITPCADGQRHRRQQGLRRDHAATVTLSDNRIAGDVFTDS